jgi:hypothetical protein
MSDLTHHTRTNPIDLASSRSTTVLDVLCFTNVPLRFLWNFSPRHQSMKICTLPRLIRGSLMVSLIHKP